MNFSPRYSRTASSEFWKAIEAIPKDKQRKRILKLALELDDLESQVLAALAVHGKILAKNRKPPKLKDVAPRVFKKVFVKTLSQRLRDHEPKEPPRIFRRQFTDVTVRS